MKIRKEVLEFVMNRVCIIITILVLLLSACAGNSKWNGMTFTKHKNHFKTHKVAPEENRSMFLAADDTTINYNINIEMDFVEDSCVENPEICRRINQYLISNLLNLPYGTEIDSALSQYSRMCMQEFDDMEYMPEYYTNVTGKADYGMDGVINYTFQQETYSGGAHPMTITTILNFRTDTGERININDVIPDSLNGSLTQLLTRKLMECTQSHSIEELHEKGFLQFNEMFVSDNFWLAEDSLIFFYNVYDIAPYAIGTTTLSFSLEELQPLTHK